MAERILHIITHDVPYPADFGGVIDLFYKIKALHANQVKIILHCFVNQRAPHIELDKYCREVHYYPRATGFLNFSFSLPYIVHSRKHSGLIKRLQEDEHPVLLEGIHCSYPLYAGLLKNRNVLLRLHNAEYEYYHHLGIHEKNPLKKWYFQHESKLLKKYETKLAHSTKIAAVSEQDVQLYQRQLNATNISHLPVFLPYTEADAQPGQGYYCLYHGNLAINENEEAAIWLLREIFSDLDVPLVIAGKDPSEQLLAMAKINKNTCLVQNPSDQELHDMIAKAQINILPSFNNTGVKLKLLNALYNGRHCLVNHAGVEGSGLDEACVIAEGAASFKAAIVQLYQQPFSLKQKTERNELLQQHYNTQKNVEWIKEVFWKGWE